MNVSNLAAMKSVVWAFIFHVLSRDDNNQCCRLPSDTDIWCEFKNSTTSGLLVNISSHCQLHLWLQRGQYSGAFASEHSVKRPLNGWKQNSNENLKSVFWTGFSKRFLSLATEVRVRDTILCFNDGVQKKNNSSDILGVKCGLKSLAVWSI